jgi:predicted nuclease with TOPRIM domain
MITLKSTTDKLRAENKELNEKLKHYVETAGSELEKKNERISELEFEVKELESDLKKYVEEVKETLSRLQEMTALGFSDDPLHHLDVLEKLFRQKNELIAIAREGFRQSSTAAHKFFGAMLNDGEMINDFNDFERKD